MQAVTHPFLERAWTRNPFDCDRAKANSSYCGYAGDGLVRLLESSPPSALANVTHDAFREFVLDNAFPCLGARAALNRDTYRFGAYERLGDDDVTMGLARDLYAFATERHGFGGDFTTFVAVFREPRIEDEKAFEARLWSQLQKLHDLDAQHHSWDSRVSSDPHDGSFSFSFAGTAFFVVGMNANSTRPSRQFSWPTLVFNAHEQFENLRLAGKLPLLKEQIRKRDALLAGDLNANLADFGDASEARQYSGRVVEEGWKCPFDPHS